ncbi:NAD-dependent epimerase/dehydratase family protein [Halalkalibacter urbisdiaboli]|uniref:NAD-dependent epimerase/dehydratase family protein n=1 Tax=Halalkalibacter urbisdiaboli TaxID=1960589 RepID=UPI000B448404|nr:NAD(P)H-binding protein [Halalkalibacter urbisdiaboli]
MLLITGITGHTGRYFLQELINNKYEGAIRCIVRDTSDTSLLDDSGLNIEKVVGDIRDKQFLDECMKGIDTIVHIVNIRHTIPIIKAAINNNVQRAICVHTTGIYSKFKIASEEYKIIEAELYKLLEAVDIKVTILRPTMIYGDLCDHNMSRFIKMVDRFRLFPVINHGKGLIQPVNARDLGKAYYNVLMLPVEKARSEYNLSGEKPITMLEAFKLINESLGKNRTFISFPLNFGVFLARCLKTGTLGKVDYVEKVQRMSEDRCFSHEEAKEDFRYSPEPFDIGIAREVEEYLKRK